jgi:hypothetical protein
MIDVKPDMAALVDEDWVSVRNAPRGSNFSPPDVQKALLLYHGILMCPYGHDSAPEHERAARRARVKQRRGDNGSRYGDWCVKSFTSKKLKRGTRVKTPIGGLKNKREVVNSTIKSGPIYGKLPLWYYSHNGGEALQAVDGWARPPVRADGATPQQVAAWHRRVTGAAVQDVPLGTRFPRQSLCFPKAQA